MIERYYIGRLLISFDQLGNAIAGGNPDVTISARLYYLSEVREVLIARWLMLLVDFVFYPVDGVAHCEKAYINHEDEDIRRGSDVALIALCLITLPFLLPIYIVNLLLVLCVLKN